jgi:hypothetical protein
LVWTGEERLGRVRIGTVRGLRGAMSDFPREDVVRVLEDVQAFLGRFKGSDVKETIYLSQLVANVLAKVKQTENI